MSLLKNFPIFKSQFINGITAWGSRITMAASQIIIIKYLIDYLGTNSSYAVYIILIALYPFAILADFGLGQTAQNMLSELKSNSQESNLIVVTIIRILFISVTISSTIILIISWAFGPWYLHLVAPEFNAMQQRNAASIAGLIMVSQVFWTISYRMMYGFGRIIKANCIATLIPLVSLINIISVKTIFSHGDPQHAIYYIWLPQSIIGILALLIFYTNSIRNIKNKIYNYIKILKRSIGFWIFSILSAMVLQVDYLILSHIKDLSQIASYGVISKVYLFQNTLIQAYLATQAPKISYFFIRQKYRLIDTKIYVILKINLVLASVLSIIFGLTMNSIMKILSPNISIYVPIPLLILLGMYQLIRAWTDTYAMVLLSKGHLKPFWIFIPLQAVISICGQITLSRYFGVEGLVLGLILSYIATVSWGLPYFHNKTNKPTSSTIKL